MTPSTLFRWLTAVTLVALALIASSPRAASAKEIVATEKMVELFDELAKELQGAGSDCDASAEAVDEWLEEHKETLPQVSIAVEAELEGLSDDKLLAFERRIGEALGIVMIRVTRDCATHENFQKAIQTLDEVMASDGAVEQDQEIEGEAAEDTEEPLPTPDN